MKQLLFLLLLISNAALGQTNCTQVTKTTTGILIKNNGMYPTKYRLEVIGRPDSTTVTIGVGKTLPITIAWCDSLYITAVPTGSCSCSLARIALYSHCGVLASQMLTSCARDGNTLTYTITPLADGLGGFNLVYVVGDRNQSVFVPIGNHPLGVPFVHSINIK